MNGKQGDLCETVFAVSRVLLICFFPNTLKVMLLKVVVVVAVKKRKGDTTFCTNSLRLDSIQSSSKRNSGKMG
ncbi:uncharacterized protein Gasu_64300 [Galdieria sulphuraria]|uniref:Uncharacterized protein n=1 Tax=Galdieria sulphuraria TaxID=130081 RepID=M2VS33_GALSU|nr:uncharacterized protein Gasu_64300 [Galdieria sulphuraria]EME25911.1 hypothetical protein Gasu_64300 [Galdieria sulphuraria]|eukprot:XP_005702431.1 hypothetical protein Gasu_64300 [Galdieria sulphuraria]